MLECVVNFVTSIALSFFRLNSLYFLSCRDGRICVGDELVAINGKSLAGLEKQDAVNLLRSSPRLVQIVINPKVCLVFKFCTFEF